MCTIASGLLNFPESKYSISFNIRHAKRDGNLKTQEPCQTLLTKETRVHEFVDFHHFSMSQFKLRELEIASR